MFAPTVDDLCKVAIRDPRGQPRLFDLSVPHSGDTSTDLFAARRVLQKGLLSSNHSGSM
jgi:hypothetical protein